MVEIARYRVGAVELVRVPYFDVALDPAVVALTAEQIGAIEWSTPSWATTDRQVLVGIAVWVIASGDRLIVVDPCLAADSFLRSGPEAIGHQEAVFTAMRDAGFPPEQIDVVVLSHLDGIGMVAAVAPDGSWVPAFPNARVVITNAEIDFLAGGGSAQGLDAFNALVSQGVVDGVDDGFRITDDVVLEMTGAHTPGHALVQVRSDGERATFVGHLALSPLNVAMGDAAAVVADAAEHESLLVGPLWPYPGAVHTAGDRVLVAAD